MPRRRRYNHAFTIAFELESYNPGEAVTAEELFAGLSQRFSDLVARYRQGDHEIVEACGMPFDTFEVKEPTLVESDDTYQHVTLGERTWFNSYSLHPAFNEVMTTAQYDHTRSVATPQWRAVIGINPATGESDSYSFERRWK